MLADTPNSLAQSLVNCSSRVLLMMAVCDNVITAEFVSCWWCCGAYWREDSTEAESGDDCSWA